MKTWGKAQEAHSLQGDKDFPAGHVLEAAVGLVPIPLDAKDSGDMGSALIPMGINDVLDFFKTSVGNGSASYG
jgi:hypothetical protein